MTARYAIWRRYITSAERDALMRVVHGALREHIRAHGPIDGPRLPSASKRVVGQLMTHVHNREQDGPMRASRQPEEMA